MLRLLGTNIDICRISKVLGKQRLKSSITNSTIIIYTNEIPDDVVDIVFANATIISAQNYQLDDSDTGIDMETNSKQENEINISLPVEEVKYINTSKPDAEDNVFAKNSTNSEVEKTSKSFNKNGNNGTSEIQTVSKSKLEISTKEVTHNEESSDETIDSEYYVQNSNDMLGDLRMDTDLQNTLTNTKISKSEMVYRGEVYKLGYSRNDDDREGKIKECVIIIQNDYQNSASDDTIALFCTTHFEKCAPIRFSFQFNKSTVFDYIPRRLGVFDHCSFFVGKINGINRKQLGDYLGTMNNEFMNNLQPTIDFCLGLKRSRTVNLTQLKILRTISTEDLFKISESKVNDEIKVEEFLKLFGFDMSGNGIEYVKDSILITRTLSNYTLDFLAQIIAEKKDVEAKEVLRLIVARIKENFHFKKSPAISFIRLIERFLKKG